MTNALDELIAASKRRYVRTDYIPGIYLKLGDRENTVRWLEQGAKDESVKLATFPFDNPLIKDDPRVQRIAASVKAKLKPLD